MAELGNGKDETWKAAYLKFAEDFGLPSDGIGMFGIDQRFGVDDVRTATAESVTGGGGDKKLDIIYLDKTRQLLVVAQCYESAVARQSAPANKASDLNSAVAWLLNSQLSSVPEEIRGKVSEVREALDSESVRDFHLWYVHNLPESRNAELEVKNAARTATRLLQSRGGVQVLGAEVGTETLERWYRGSRRAIKVIDRFELRVPDAIESSSERWDAVTTLVPGKWLRDLFLEHKEDLFSANVRDYLGSRRSDDNINYGIKQTANEEPADFVVYNNGVTALVLDYKLGARTKSGRKLSVTGVSVVNGAQTTGSIGTLDGDPATDLLVPVRFVKSGDDSLLDNIVRFNNLQNKVQAADFRSSDETQNRLRSEFDGMSGVSYDGGRRGGATDAIRRSRDLIPSHTVGQVLTAFHGDPVAAYDKRSEIWIDDAMYSRIFSEHTSAAHVVFTFSLYDSLMSRLLELREKSKRDEPILSDAEANELAFLSLKGAPFLLVEAVARSLETILNDVISSRFALEFKNKPSLDAAAEYWKVVIDAVLPLSDQLRAAFVNGRISREGKDEALVAFDGLFRALQRFNPDAFHEFKRRVRLT